jgi:excisionase family DNA binding protein
LEQILEHEAQIQGQERYIEMLDHFRNRYMSIEEAATYLQTTKSWIYQNHKITNMPVYKLNQKLLFRAEELDSWMGTVKS